MILIHVIFHFRTSIRSEDDTHKDVLENSSVKKLYSFASPKRRSLTYLTGSETKMFKQYIPIFLYLCLILILTETIYH